MESPSHRRFHSGGGYTGFDLADDFRSNVQLNHQSPSHAPLNSPRRLQQQLAQRMIQMDYDDNEQMHFNSTKHSRNEAYDDSYTQSSRHNYDLGHDPIDEADFIPPWDRTAPPTTPEKNSRNDYLMRVAERTMLRQKNNDGPTFHDAYASNIWGNANAASPPPTSLTQMSASPSQQQPLSPRSTKNVSFNTRDKVHQWDDQLEQLKHVDEEFLAVAKYLLEDVHNVADDYLEEEEEHFEALYTSQNEWKITKGRGEKGRGFFANLFQCGDVHVAATGSGSGEGSCDSDSYKPYLRVDGEVLDDRSGLLERNQRKKKYKLTHKMLKDFKAALKYRMDNLEKENQEEDEEGMAAKTREIARKVEAYGLPKPWGKEVPVEEDQDVEKEGSKEDSVESFRSDKNRQQRNDTHFFPLLPIDNDDDANNVGAANEKYYQHSDKSTSALSTPNNKSHLLSFFSSIFKSKSTPTEEECQQHLYRIGREIKKAKQMNDTTHNVAVQSACARRIAKLNDEKRFYQIIKEQYKIRHMYKTSKMESVKFACKERMKQLMVELESLDLEKEEDIAIPPESSKEVAEEQQDATESEGKNWYAKALQYVNATNDLQHPHQHQNPPQQEKFKQDHYHQENNPRYNDQMPQYSQNHQQYSQNHPQHRNNQRSNAPSSKEPRHSYYQHQRHNYAQNRRSPRETERPVQAHARARFEPQHHNADVFRQSSPQQPMYTPLHVQEAYKNSVPPTNNINHQQQYIQGDSIPKRSHTEQRLPVATAVPPKKEGLCKLISYLAP